MGNRRSDGEAASLTLQQPVIQTIQPGDSELTCKELMTQMDQMDQIAAYSATGGEGEGTKKTIVTELMRTGANVAFGLIPIPGVGSALGALTGALSGTVGNTGQQQQMQRQNTVVQAQQRKQHLLTLYDEKKCYAPSPSSQP